MGTHFAPPFAIITLDKIEGEALRLLGEKQNVRPEMYVRYIDDILLGPFSRDTALFDKILETFNSINSSIQFTLEVPKTSEPINFLDISIFIVENSIRHTWYSKNSHSEITLKPDTWLPKHVKFNFVKNSVRQVADRCSDTEMKSLALNKLNNRLSKNGFTSVNFEKILNSKRKPRPAKSDNVIFLKTLFINDRFTKKVNNILKKYNFPVKVVSKPNSKLSHCFNNRKIDKHDHCSLCDSLPNKYCCDVRYVVYKATCNLCNKFYIGETCRPLYLRLNEHRRCIKNRDRNSALADHILNEHSGVNLTFDDFRLHIISKFSNPVETRIGEARSITTLKPEINRKEEMAQW